MTEAQLKEILRNYSSTFDLPSKKWVKEMTESELKTRGYLKSTSTSSTGKSSKTAKQ